MSLRSVSLCFFVTVLTNVYGFDNCVQNGLYAHATDCSKFYSCAPQGPVLMQCPLGLHFNPQIRVCDWPEHAGCHAENVCPIYPHPTDCARFYMCSRSGRVLMDCPAGLHFNSRFSVCDWPENVKCNATLPNDNKFENNNDIPVFSSNISYDQSGLDETTSTERMTTNEISDWIETERATTNKMSSNELFENSETISTNAQPESTDTSDGIEGTSKPENFSCKGTAWPHELDCKKFYMASPTGQVELSCPQGLLFHPQLLQCDWAKNVPCPGHLDDSTTTSTTPFEEKRTTSTVSNAKTSTLLYELPAEAITTNEPQICQNDVWPHPTDCAAFYVCSPSGPVQEICLEGMLFNHTMMLCDWAENVQCPGHLDESTTISTTPFEEETSTFTVSNDKTSTSSFELPAEATITNKPQICQNDVWPHPTDCAAYYMCGSTGAVRKECPDGLLFNPTIMLCDWAVNVECLGHLDESTTASATLLAEETSTFIELSDETLTSLSSELPAEVTITNKPQICQNDVWPRPTDCAAYYMCGSTGAVRKECPEGLLFNPTLMLCDWAVNVQCHEHLDESTTISTTPFEEETSTFTVSNDKTSTSLFELPAEATTTNKPQMCQNDVWPHPTDCAAFYVCGPFGPVQEKCLDGMLFNHTMMLCDWADYVQCSGHLHESTTSSTTLFAEETSTFTKSNDETSTSSSSSSSELPSEATTNEPEICQNNVWPHPTDCAAYYMCGSTGAIRKECPEGLLFNPAIKLCDWAENVQCPGSLNESTTASTTLFAEETSTFTKSNDETLTSLSSELPAETTTINKPQICQNDVWPHPTDCAAFYMCGSTGPVRKECPEGLLFNPTIMLCDWAVNVQCPGHLDESTTASTTLLAEETSTFTELNDETLTSLSSELPAEATITNKPQICQNDVWPHPTDCAAYYMCGSTGAVRKECPNGLLFNPTIMLCDWAVNVQCRGHLDESTTIFTTLFEEETSTFTVSNDKNSTSLFELPAEATITNKPQICQNDVWPHPTDCAAFYMCGSTGAVLKECSEGLLFNPLLHVCDWPDNVECSPALSTTTESSLVDYENSFPMSEQELTTVEACRGESTWPHPTDCAKFFTCAATGLVEGSCPDGKLFNPALRACDWSKNVQCPGHLDESTITFTTPLKEETSTSTESNDEPSTSSSLTELHAETITNEPQICQNNIWPHPTDCAAFYMCGSTGAVLKECSEGLLFNPLLHVCDWPDNVECFSALSTTESLVDYENSSPMSEQELTTFEACRGESTWPHPTDCAKFFTCAATGPAEASCPDGKFFNPALRACDSSENVTCAQHLTKSTLKSKSVIWPHPTDCAKFFIGSIERTCAYGLLFNATGLVCDWPENVRCDKRESSRHIDDDVEICLQERGGHYLRADPSSCDYYWICHNGVGSRGTCPKGSLFNGALNACVTFKESDRIKCFT